MSESGQNTAGEIEGQYVISGEMGEEFMCIDEATTSPVGGHFCTTYAGVASRLDSFVY